MAQKTKMFRISDILTAGSALLVASAVALAAAAPADAQRNRDRDEQSEAEQQNRTLSARVGEAVQAAVEAQDAEQWGQMIQLLNPLLNQEITPYERSIVLRLRGTAYFQQDNLAQATQDFLGVINTGALTQDEANTLRINVGQLYMAQEQIDEGIRQFELAIANGATLNTRLAKMLATAYVQAERFQEGLRYAEQFYRDEQNKTLNDYNLMQYYYTQLNRPQDELRVIRDGLSAYPGERRSWQNLVAIFARLNREEDAFEANKLMYLNGLFQECNEVFRLAQYYSAFDVPYRGASILERAINSGRCEGDREQLERLANMWRQAAEFDRAIPVIERIASQTGEGEWWLRLAEANYQLNNFAEAESAFETALERGGLDNAGDAWILLGDSRLKQGKRQEALAAFRQATNFRGSAQRANGFIRFVTSQIEGEQRRAVQREQIVIDECSLTIAAERRSLVLIGEVDADGRVTFPEGAIPDQCSRYFNQRTGDQIREAGMSDEEAAQYQADQEAARQARAAAG
ncbi:MAG: tetratricopeptide repeat protein [Oceanicaulis sp.]